MHTGQTLQGKHQIELRIQSLAQQMADLLGIALEVALQSIMLPTARDIKNQHQYQQGKPERQGNAQTTLAPGFDRATQKNQQ